MASMQGESREADNVIGAKLDTDTHLDPSKGDLIDQELIGEAAAHYDSIHYDIGLVGEDEEVDEDALPSWANEANQSLHERVLKRERALEKQVSILTDNADRVAIMREHLKNVEQEISNTQALLDSKVKSIETEDHLKRLSERELSQLRIEIQKALKQKTESDERSNATQNAIFLSNEKLEKLRLQLNWNQEELEQWSLASKQKQDDNAMLEQYKHSDDARLAKLSLHIERLTKQSQELQHKLEQEVTETQTVQIELDKTAEDFKALHLERQEVLMQWEETQKATTRRDADVQNVAQEVAQLKVMNDFSSLAQMMRNMKLIEHHISLYRNCKTRSKRHWHHRIVFMIKKRATIVPLSSAFKPQKDQWRKHDIG